MGNRWISFFLLAVGLISCAGREDEVAQAVKPTALATAMPLATVTLTPVPPPATNTPLPTTTPLPTKTAVSTSTPRPPTETPFIPTKTAVPTATFTPTSTPTAIPPTPFPSEFPPSSVPLTGVNILPNGSFEEGHYNQGGVPEFQLPNGWRLEWDEGPTGYGTESWDVWVRPETRVLPDYQLPPEEHSLFIYDGTHTVKIFKGFGAISVRLLTDMYLTPGTYRMTINVYPDLYTSYDGGKIWADDPDSGQVRFIISGGTGGTSWRLPAFGQRNTMTHEFTISQAQMVTVGVGIRGPFAIANNGWVMDAWSLQQISN